MSSVSHPATVFLFCYLSCTRNLTKPHCFGEENEKIFPGAQPPNPLPSSDTTQTPTPATPLGTLFLTKQMSLLHLHSSKHLLPPPPHPPPSISFTPRHLFFISPFTLAVLLGYWARVENNNNNNNNMQVTDRPPPDAPYSNPGDNCANGLLSRILRKGTPMTCFKIEILAQPRWVCGNDVVEKYDLLVEKNRVATRRKTGV